VKRLVVFDLDGTLAPSKSSIDTEMATLLTRLLGVVRVAIISGGGWPQFNEQLLSHLGHGDHLKRLSLLPVCGTKFYEYTTNWTLRYSDDFTDDEKAKITHALNRVFAAIDLAPNRTWGEVIEDRGSQITYSALGQQAPLAAKKTFDPDFVKRTAIKARLDPLLPEFSVRLGGTTSIDITKAGIDKGYGVRQLSDVLAIEIGDMIFVGDALFPGGNDHAAEEAGVESISTTDPEETKRLIETMLACAVGLGLHSPTPAEANR
jgi:phosphomannomutase